MLFKNATIYTFETGFFPSFAKIEEALAQHPARKCERREARCAGWDKPLGPDSGNYVHVAGPHALITLRKTERVLPEQVVKEHLEERVAAIRRKEQRRVGRKERANLKDEIIADLLPKAFQQSKTISGYFDSISGQLIIDASSTTQAEEFTHFLWSALDILPKKLNPDAPPNLLLTKWVTSCCPNGFHVLEDAILIDAESSKASLRHHYLSGDEVSAHINHGKEVHELALKWKDRIEFVLTSDLILKRLRFGDAVLKQASAIESDDRAARFDADFSIMAGELSELTGDLILIFGQQMESAAA